MIPEPNLWADLHMHNHDQQPLRDEDMTTSTSVSTNNEIGYNNANNSNNYTSYPPHSINNNNNNGTPVHNVDRPHATGLSSMTISGVSGSSGFVHLTDGCRTLTLPRRSNPSAAAQIVANQHGGSGTLTATSTLTCRDTLKEELELDNHAMVMSMSSSSAGGPICNDGRPNGVNNTGLGLGGGMTTCSTAAASMNNVNPSAVMEAENMRQRQRWTRRWYLLVIVLLYIGLLASFSLNVSLLLRKPNSSSSISSSSSSSLPSSLKSSDGTGEHISNVDGTPTINEDGSISGLQFPHGEFDPSQKSSSSGGYAYTTSCLVKVPCESGNYWKCDVNTCVPCPQGFYQPQWGQTSCWPCPFNTTTDSEGSTSPTECKRRKCPFYTKDGLGILESPNFPGEYPAGAECHWRVRPGRNKRVLVIISNIELDENCGDVLTIRKTDRPKTGVVFETCQGNEEPIIFTGHSRNLWVDFVADHNSSGRGFQISFLTIDDELGYLVDAIVSDEMIDSFDKRPNDMSIEDKHLLSRLLLLLNPNYASSPTQTRNRRPSRKKKPIINVVEEDDT